MTSKSEIAAWMKDMDSLLGGNDEAQQVTSFIDTGYPPLNVALSGRPDGGLPEGRMVEIFGESSTGKTALATKWMVEAQRRGGVAGFIDWERSFDVSLARGFGLNDERPYWIYKRSETWEAGNTVAAQACKLIRDRKVIAPDAPILFVFDSIASALPKSVKYDSKGKEKELDEYTMNDTTALARVTSTTLKTMAQIAGDFNATFLYLNQMRLKPGVVYGDPRTTPGGKAMEFYSTCRMALGRELLKEGKGSDAEFAGQRISIQVVKSKLTRPFQKAKMRLMYDDEGVAFFDVITSMIEFMLANDILKKAGSYVVWEGSNTYASALAKKADSDPATLTALTDLLKSALSK